MKYGWIDSYLSEKKGVRKDFKEEWNWLRYMIEDKMFAAVCYGDDGKAQLITLRLTRVEHVYL